MMGDAGRYIRGVFCGGVAYLYVGYSIESLLASGEGCFLAG